MIKDTVIAWHDSNLEARNCYFCCSCLQTTVGTRLAKYFISPKGEFRMEFSGTQTIAAPIDKVWAFLLDVNNVAECAPGFQSMEELGEEHWKALVAVGLGSVKAKFTMDVTRADMHEPEQMVVKA